jgi:hypothetical protein
VVETSIGPPYMGWVPDLPPQLVGFKGARSCYNIVPLATRERGLFLGPDQGYAQIDSANLPLGIGAARPITLLAQYQPGGGAALQQIAIASGVNPGTDIELSRLVAGSWTTMTISAAGAGGVAPEVDSETLFDFAVFPVGAPGAAHRGTFDIPEPILIMCGGDDSGPTSAVLCTPDSTGSLNVYDELDRWSALDPFKAMSCESNEGRMLFLGTNEAGTAFDRRLRWSAPGTADPDPALRGAGYRDFLEFGRRGLRAETIGNKVACYFEDGVAFAIPKFTLTDAFRTQTVSTQRGLLATNALVSVDANFHFGLFTDGWYFMDAAGRWKEAGVVRLEETKGKNIELNKWKTAFYDRVDLDNRHRISCAYDAFWDRVYISYPDRVTGTQQTLIYDVDTDTTWPMSYGPTCFGVYDRSIVAGTLWSDEQTAGTLWSERQALGTRWADLMSQFGMAALVHGTSGGLVMGHSPDITARDGVEPYWYYETHETPVTPNRLHRQVFERLGLEYMNVQGTGAALQAITNAANEFHSQSVSLNETGDSFGEMHTAYAHYRLGGTHHGWRASGLAPFLIRSWIPRFRSVGNLDTDQ